MLSLENPDQFAWQSSANLWNVFHTREKPAPLNIVYDNSDLHLECVQIRELFGGRNWWSLTLKELQTQPEALCFMTDVGYCYYLPAFLLYSLECFDQADVISINTVSQLAPAKLNNDQVAQVDDRIRAFTFEECASIKEVLVDLKSFFDTNYGRKMVLNGLNAIEDLIRKKRS